MQQRADLILDQRAYGIGELIEGADAGEVPAVNGVGGGDVLVVSGEHAHHGHLPVQQGPDLPGGV